MSAFDVEALADARWFAGKGQGVGDARVVDRLPLGDAELLLLEAGGERYAVPAVDEREARVGEGAYLALLDRAGVDAGAGAAELELGADQSHVSVRIGDVLLKSYRRLTGGQSIEAEVGRFLSERARYAHAPAFLGEVVWHGSTVAVAHAFMPGAHDLYEHIAEALAAEFAGGTAPVPAGEAGSVTLPAAAVAEPLGERLAQLHAALAGMAPPRPATREDMATWRGDALSALERARRTLAGEDAAVVEGLVPAIHTALAALDELPPPPVQRVHGDLHLGQLLLAADGPVFIDFEGDPLLTPEQRRGPLPPLRDVATLRRSIDHVARSAARRAAARTGRALDAAPAEAWIAEALARLDAAYTAAGGASDPALVHALEVAKECGELLYAATYLPSWLWAPIESLRALVGGPPYPAAP